MSTIKKQLPQTSEPHIGFELEFDAKNASLAKTFEHDINDSLSRLMQKHTCQVHREAITYQFGDDKILGYELTMCLPISYFINPIALALGVLETHREKPFVDNRCGLHIHLDCRFRDNFVLRKQLRPYESELIAMTSDWRQKNPKSYAPDGLYVRNRYQTLEVRFMDGNFDPRRTLDYMQKLMHLST